MRRVLIRLSRRLPAAAALAGPPLAAWGGYGLGVTGADLSGQSLLAAGLVAGGAAAVLPAVRRSPARPDDGPAGPAAAAGSFARDAAVLEALAPAAAGHPEGLKRLRGLADLLFEVRHPARPAAVGPAAAVAPDVPPNAVTDGGAE